MNISKIIKLVVGIPVVIFVAIVAAGMYKFNYLAGLDGYDVDGNKIKKIIYFGENSQAVSVEKSAGNDGIYLTMKGQTFFLKNAISASGTKYENKEQRLTFWIKGNDFLIEKDGKIIIRKNEKTSK